MTATTTTDKYLDLFSGIGGFHLGLNMAGYEFSTVYHSDIDEYANKVYADNFPDAIPLGDITQIDEQKIKEIMPIDIVTAGFPCQDISVAGKQKGLEHNGEKTRSGLFFEIIRIIRICRPRIIILENVPNILTRPDWMGAVLGELANCGYNAEWKIISAANVGAQHERKRWWCVAYPA